MQDLPPNITIAPGRLEIQAPTAIVMLESLMTLALIMQNDLDRFQNLIEPPLRPPEIQGEELRELFKRSSDEAHWVRVSLVSLIEKASTENAIRATEVATR